MNSHRIAEFIFGNPDLGWHLPGRDRRRHDLFTCMKTRARTVVRVANTCRAGVFSKHTPVFAGLLLSAAATQAWQQDPRAVSVLEPTSKQILQTKNPYGIFNGPLIAEFDRNGRTITLKYAYIYTDPAGSKWVAPAGSVVDGASIPQVAWSFVGGPLDGVYRNASVIHDVACIQRNKPWELVHLTFYYAMLASGVGERTAKILYAAVYAFGPRWGVDGKDVPFFFVDTRGQRVPVEKATLAQQALAFEPVARKISTAPGSVTLADIQSADSAVIPPVLANQPVPPLPSAPGMSGSSGFFAGLVDQVMSGLVAPPDPSNPSMTNAFSAAGEIGATGASSQPAMGNFCITSVGRFGPGPPNLIGSPCFVDGSLGWISGIVGR